MFWIIFLFISVYADKIHEQDANQAVNQVNENVLSPEKSDIEQSAKIIEENLSKHTADTVVVKQLSKIRQLIQTNPEKAANIYISLWLNTLDNKYLDKAVDIYIGKNLPEAADRTMQSLLLLKDNTFSQGRLKFSWARILYWKGQNTHDTRQLLDSKKIFLSFIELVGEENLDTLTRDYIKRVMLSIDNILSNAQFAQIVYLYNSHIDEAIVILKHCEEFLKEYGHSVHATTVKKIQADLQKILSTYVSKNKPQKI